MPLSPIPPGLQPPSHSLPPPHNRLPGAGMSVTGQAQAQVSTRTVPPHPTRWTARSPLVSHRRPPQRSSRFAGWTRDRVGPHHWTFCRGPSRVLHAERNQRGSDPVPGPRVLPPPPPRTPIPPFARGVCTKAALPSPYSDLPEQKLGNGHEAAPLLQLPRLLADLRCPHCAQKGGRDVVWYVVCVHHPRRSLGLGRNQEQSKR